jgi:hypothetical protein
MSALVVVGATGSVGRLVVDEALRQATRPERWCATRIGPAGCRTPST